MNVPSMGDSIAEGTMVEWLKDVGDYAAEDEVIAIVETIRSVSTFDSCQWHGGRNIGRFRYEC